MHAEARHIYEILGGDAGVRISYPTSIASTLRHPQTSSLYVLLQAAACRRMLGDIKEAAEVYEHGTSSVSTQML